MQELDVAHSFGKIDQQFSMHSMGMRADLWKAIHSANMTEARGGKTVVPGIDRGGMSLCEAPSSPVWTIHPGRYCR